MSNLDRNEEMNVTPNGVIRPRVEWRVCTSLPTRYGLFEMHIFVESSAGGQPEKEHVAMVVGDLKGQSRVPVRVHSECITSEVFSSLKCDCREQLESALGHVASNGLGAIFYLRQEGRGIGLTNKIRAYRLQSQGFDTVDANRLLDLPDDAREYSVVKVMNDYFGIKSVSLMTNNPEKVKALEGLGVEVAQRVPVLIAPNQYSSSYLETKRSRMAHAIPTSAHSSKNIR